MADVLAEVIDRLWPGSAFTVEPLSGGITNANFKVTSAASRSSSACPGKNTELLGIDRVTEVAANRAAAAIGVAPEVVAVDEETGCIVTRFFEGRPIPMAELATEPTLGAVIATLLQGARRRAGRQSSSTISSVIRAYHDEARPPRRVRALRLRAGASRCSPASRPCGRSGPACSATTTCSTRTCSHDGSIRILDWEYAGMADPYFDLANFSVNNELGSERDESVLRHYFGTADDSKLAALALMKLVSELREAMWGVVQLAISELEVDFVAYATERGERFEVLLAAMELERTARELAVRPRLTRARRRQEREARVLRVEERLGDDLAADETPEDADLDTPPGLDLGRGQVGVGDRALDAVAVAAARDAPDGAAVDPHRLRAEHDGAGVVEHEAGEPARRRRPPPGGPRAR